MVRFSTLFLYISMNLFSSLTLVCFMGVYLLITAMPLSPIHVREVLIRWRCRAQEKKKVPRH